LVSTGVGAGGGRHGAPSGLALSGAGDAPPDLAKTRGAKGLPEALQRELAALGLL
jgi:hypothetical protein